MNAPDEILAMAERMEKLPRGSAYGTHSNGVPLPLWLVPPWAREKQQKLIDAYRGTKAASI